MMQVVARLVAVPGIGRWTAEIYAMFSLGRADVFAPGDLALQEAARMLFGLAARPNEKALRRDGRGLVALAGRCGAAALGLLPPVQAARRDQVTRELVFGRQAAASGKAKSLVIFLHGYGADGADLLGLADPLAPHLPDTVFVAPDAPERPKGDGLRLSVVLDPAVDGSTQAEAGGGDGARRGRIWIAFIDARMAEEGVSDAAVALVGFSQGTMMALEVAPRRATALAGVVGFSGRLIAPERLAGEVLSRPPMLLVHGDAR